jgi:transposase
MPSPVTPEQIAAVLPEFRALLQAIIDHYERRITASEAELLAAKQELAAVKKTPRNSSLPSSNVHPHAKPAPDKPKSGRKPGAQPGHAKHERALIPVEQCQEIVPLKPTACRRYNTKLSGDDP